MAENPRQYIPTLRPFDFDADLMTVPKSRICGSLDALDVWADGAVKVDDTNGTSTTRDFTGLAKPVRWVLSIGKVYSVGTTVALADMDGLQL